MARRKPPRKPIAFEKITVAQERLPLPFVHYPGHYGTFMAFSESGDSNPILCECAKLAIKNYIGFRLLKKSPPNSDRRRMFLVDSYAFPISIVEWVSALQLELSPSCIETLQFRPGICHCCNQAVPTYRWCHEMYGSPFKQNYGWYLSQFRLEIGVSDLSVNYDLCPDEIRVLMVIDPNTFIDKHARLLSSDPIGAQKFERDFTKQKRQVDRVIENTVRERFGIRPMGFGSTGESMLFQIVRRLFPGNAVHRCARPDFLQGLELDVFVPAMLLGFEFQGQQHYNPVEHWGGEAGLRKLQERDRRKKEMCRTHGVKLIEVKFDEQLTEQHLLERISECRLH